jgi:hypothetical protein
MNIFRKLIRNINLIFGEGKDYIFITEFQSRGLPHDHRLLCVQNAFTFGVSKKEKIECFVDKYLKTDHTMFLIKIHNMQINQHKITYIKKTSTNLLISISKTSNETYKNIIAFR